MSMAKSKATQREVLDDFCKGFSHLRHYHKSQKLLLIKDDQLIGHRAGEKQRLLARRITSPVPGTYTTVPRAILISHEPAGGSFRRTFQTLVEICWRRRLPFAVIETPDLGNLHLVATLVECSWEINLERFLRTRAPRRRAAHIKNLEGILKTRLALTEYAGVPPKQFNLPPHAIQKLVQWRLDGQPGLENWQTLLASLRGPRPQPDSADKNSDEKNEQHRGRD